MTYTPVPQAERYREPIVILGGGPTGLGAAWALSGVDDVEWALFERHDAVGGLSRSIVDERGFTWDLGGHVVFSHYAPFTHLLDDLFPDDQWIRHERESWIRLRERWIPYPFQNNIHRLDPEDCANCLADMIRAAIAQPNPPFATFDESFEKGLGKSVADLFMRPYNRKVWAYDPKELSASWIGDRVSVPDAARVARNVALGQDDVSWGPNNQFRFPLHGGTGAVWNAIAGRLPSQRIALDHEAVEIDTEKRIIRFANGKEQEYGSLISTIPLDRLAAICGRKDWSELAAGLMYSSTHVIGVGLEGAPTEELASKCWMYFPEEEVPFYRVTHFSHYSPNNVDDITRHWSLMAEVSESPVKPVDAGQVEDETVAGLVKAGLIESSEQVTHTWRKRLEHGYPTPSLARDGILRRLQPALREAGVLSRGRFGAWLYEVGNMDHSFMQGVEVVEYLLQGRPELTVWRPHLVNQPHPVLGWDLHR